MGRRIVLLAGAVLAALLVASGVALAYHAPSYTVSCKGGDARCYGTPKADYIGGTAGRDIVYARGGVDNIDAGASNDTVRAGDGNDGYYKGVNGGTGNDRLFGGPGGDLVLGGTGDDYSSGGPGDDTLEDGLGSNTIDGGDGDDVLNGSGGGANGGADELFGGAGNDRIIAHDGSPGDSVDCGDGTADEFTADPGDIVQPNCENDVTSKLHPSS